MFDTKTFPERTGELKKTVADAGIKNRQKKEEKKVGSAFAFYFPCFRFPPVN